MDENKSQTSAVQEEWEDEEEYIEDEGSKTVLSGIDTDSLSFIKLQKA